MAQEKLTWNMVLSAVMKLPGVRVERVSFLRRELRLYCNPSRLQMLGSVRPYTIVSERVVDKVARRCVRNHTALATMTSTIAGLPGGLAMAATLPADIVQYFYHVVILSQKLAYLYGYPDFFASQEDNKENADDELSDVSCELLTIFIGVMMGAPVAEKGIAELSKAVAGNAVTRLPRVALTRTAVFPIARQVARLIGARFSKDGFTKGVGRLIPLAGGLFSGGLTLWTFRKGGARLRRQLRAQRHLFNDDNISSFEPENLKASFVRASEAEHDPHRVQVTMIQAMINIAKINDVVSQEKYHLIERLIARANIDAQEKLDLLGNIESDYSYDIDYAFLSGDIETARSTLHNMLEVVRLSEKASTAEKMYLDMAAKALGFTKDELERMSENNS